MSVLDKAIKSRGNSAQLLDRAPEPSPRSRPRRPSRPPGPDRATGAGTVRSWQSSPHGTARGPGFRKGKHSNSPLPPSTSHLPNPTSIPISHVVPESSKRHATSFYPRRPYSGALSRLCKGNHLFRTQALYPPSPELNQSSSSLAFLLLPSDQFHCGMTTIVSYHPAWHKRNVASPPPSRSYTARLRRLRKPTSPVASRKKKKQSKSHADTTTSQVVCVC